MSLCHCGTLKFPMLWTGRAVVISFTPIAGFSLRKVANLMYIPVVLEGGEEELVRHDELQLLMTAQRVMFFKRSDGWVVPSRDELRTQRSSFDGEERRQQGG